MNSCPVAERQWERMTGACEFCLLAVLGKINQVVEHLVGSFLEARVV